MTEVKTHQIYIDKTPLNMKCVFELVDKLPDHLSKRMLYKPYEPKGRRISTEKRQ